MADKHVIIFTGGTIASWRRPYGYEPRREVIENLLNRVNHDGEIAIEMLEPLIDSSHAVPSDWTRIIQTALPYAEKGYKIIVAHGTDTLAYTAAALSYGMPVDLDVPVTITGSQCAPDVPRSDALTNLARTLAFSSAVQQPCVSVCFGRYALGATRAVKASSEHRIAFRAPKGRGIVATFKNAGDHAVSMRFNDTMPRDCFTPSGMRPIIDPARKRVAKIRLWPGTTLNEAAAILASNTNTAGVVVEAFGAGNINNTGAQYAPAPANDDSLIPGLSDLVSDWLSQNRIKTFPQLFTHMDELGKVVVLTTQTAHGGVSYSRYSAGHVPGAISGFDMTPEAAVVKLAYAFGRHSNPADVKAMMQTPLSGDFDPKYLKAAALTA